MIPSHAHTSGVAMSAATECGYESLPHPPHLLDPALSDFPLLIEHLLHTILRDSDVIVSLEDFLQKQNRNMNSSTRLEYRSCGNSGKVH